MRYAGPRKEYALVLPILTLILLATAATLPATLTEPVKGSGEYGAAQAGLLNLTYLGSATLRADGIRSLLILGYDSEAGYVDVMVSGIDYSPEPNHFDVNVVRLQYKGAAKVNVLARFNDEVDKGFVPPAELLPGSRFGLNWTAITLADNRPYEAPPLNEVRVYGIAWNGTKLSAPKVVARLRMRYPTFVLATYPWPGKTNVTALYASVRHFRSYNEWTYGYGVLTYDVVKHGLIKDVTLPVTINRSGYTYTLRYVNDAGKNVTVETKRFSVLFCPAAGSVGYAVVIYVNGSSTYVLESRVDLSSGKASGFKVVNVMKEHSMFLISKGTDEGGEYRVIVDFINTDTWEHTIILYDVSSEGLKATSSKAITKNFYRAYIIYSDGLLLLLTQNEGIITINDLRGHEAQALKFTGRFYARLAKIPNPAWPNTYVLIIGSPSSETKAYFFLINPPPGAVTATTATRSTSTTSPTTSSATTTTTTTTTTTRTSSTTSPSPTSSMSSTTVTTTRTTSITTTTATTVTTRTTKTTTSTRTTTSTKSTSTSTLTTTPSKPQSLALSKGDWLKYHVKVHGEGPLGTMGFETDVKVTVTSVSNEYVKLCVEPLKSLTYEQRSLITMGALTGNKLILALAANKPTTITYKLPLQHPSKACAILAAPTGKEETIKDSGTTMGHKYSVTCAYTPKGVLSTYAFSDTYSAGGKEVKVDITVTLTDSNKDVGMHGAGGGGSNIFSGMSLTTVLIISVVIAAAIIAVVLAVTLRKK